MRQKTRGKIAKNTWLLSLTTNFWDSFSKNHSTNLRTDKKDTLACQKSFEILASSTKILVDMRIKEWAFEG